LRDLLKDQLGLLKRQNSIRPEFKEEVKDNNANLPSDINLIPASKVAPMSKQQLIAKRVGRKMFNLPNKPKQST